MPLIMVASKACTHVGSRAARRASSSTANGTPPLKAAMSSTCSSVGAGTYRPTSCRDAVPIEGPSTSSVAP